MGKGGIVSDPKTHKEVLEKIANLATELGMTIESITFSPIQGATGNTEFLMLMTNGKTDRKPLSIDEVIKASKEEFH